MGLDNTTTEEPLRVDKDSIAAPAADYAPTPPPSVSPAEAGRVKRALSYPYTRPKGSYLFRDGKAHALSQQDFRGLHFVLAIGSNAAPTQLQRKFGERVTIPVVAVVVEGLDVVYAAIMSGYGSIPATVVKSEGTVTNIHATLLTDAQLGRMHETEGGYYFSRLVHGKGVRVFWDGAVVENVYCYVTRVGALCNDQVFAIEEIEGRGRRYTAISQTGVQAFVKGLVGWVEGVEEFVMRNVADKKRREDVMRKMRGTATVEDCFEVVEDIGSVIASVK